MREYRFPVVDDPGAPGPDVLTEERPVAPEKEGRGLPIQRALISVSDKEGVVDFARGLARHGVELISTDGTYRKLEEAGVAVTPIEQVTGFPETLDGRVKTLHPTIHIGILANRHRPEHMRKLEEMGIQPIDLVCVNLYPFEETVVFGGDRAEAIEMIDIGGSTLLRAAAKNYESVVAVSSPFEYPRILEELGKNGGVSRGTSHDLAAETFDHTARYDTKVAEWMRDHAES